MTGNFHPQRMLGIYSTPIFGSLHPRRMVGVTPHYTHQPRVRARSAAESASSREDNSREHGTRQWLDLQSLTIFLKDIGHKTPSGAICKQSVLSTHLVILVARHSGFCNFWVICSGSDSI